jgi:hypothetical protein
VRVRVYRVLRGERDEVFGVWSDILGDEDLNDLEAAKDGLRGGIPSASGRGGRNQVRLACID